MPFVYAPLRGLVILAFLEHVEVLTSKNDIFVICLLKALQQQNNQRAVQNEQHNKASVTPIVCFHCIRNVVYLVVVLTRAAQLLHRDELIIS